MCERGVPPDEIDGMVLGDCIHMLLEIHETDGVCRDDGDPALMMQTRRALLGRG